MRSRLFFRGSQRGQSLAEFAVVSSFLVLLVGGVIDISALQANRLAVSNAARGAARWASKHPQAWDNSANPLSQTIEGQAEAAGNGDTILNDDSHVIIKYLTISGTTESLCATYSVSANGGAGGLVYQSGFDSTMCPQPGDLISVTIKYDYAYLTPIMSSLFGTAGTLAASAEAVEES
jgi:hypothetical protein